MEPDRIVVTVARIEDGNGGWQAVAVAERPMHHSATGPVRELAEWAAEDAITELLDKYRDGSAAS